MWGKLWKNVGSNGYTCLFDVGCTDLFFPVGLADIALRLGINTIVPNCSSDLSFSVLCVARILNGLEEAGCQVKLLLYWDSVQSFSKSSKSLGRRNIKLNKK